MLIKKIIIVLSYLLLASCTRESGEAIKEVKCKSGEKSFGGVCVTDFDNPGSGINDGGGRGYGDGGYGGGSYGDDGEPPLGEGEGPLGEGEGPLDEGEGPLGEGEGTGSTGGGTPDDGPSTPPSSPPVSTPTDTPPPPTSVGSGSSPADLILKMKIARFNPSIGEENNPFVLWTAFEPADKISNLSVKYIAGETLSIETAFEPFDIFAEVKFNYDGTPCKVNKSKFDFDEYYRMDGSWTGAEVEVSCGGSL